MACLDWPDVVQIPDGEASVGDVVVAAGARWVYFVAGGGVVGFDAVIEVDGQVADRRGLCCDA